MEVSKLDRSRVYKETDKGSPEHSESIVTEGTLETDTEGEIEKARDRKKTDKGSPEHSESAAHRLWVIMFPLSFVSRYFLISS